jgi:DNA-binding ferritin-like protein
LHRLFDEQRRQLDYWLGRVIEQGKSIGLRKRGATAEKPALSEAETKSSAGLPARTMIGDLLTRHERIARQLRDDIERLADPVTADLLLALVEFHETTAWMLRVVKNSSNATQGG